MINISILLIQNFRTNQFFERFIMLYVQDKQAGRHFQKLLHILFNVVGISKFKDNFYFVLCVKTENFLSEEINNNI